MLPPNQQAAFLVFATVTLGLGVIGFVRVYRLIMQGRPDTDRRTDRLPLRILAALRTTLSQSRTFRRRPWVSLFHAFIFYGFVIYLAVNFVDLLEAFFPFAVSSRTAAGAFYNLAADVLSLLVLVGVVALVVRRFLLPSRRDFRFNPRTVLSPSVAHGRITRDSLFVSCFILIHVGSRALGSAAHLADTSPDAYRPFASLLARGIPAEQAYPLQIFGFWGALGSILAFLAYFPYSKHLHLFAAPLKYVVQRERNSGYLPSVDLNLDSEDATQAPGAGTLAQLTWPRLLDAYSCVQCNRCQDVCPATATGKALSPSALEINKRMALNAAGSRLPATPLLTAVLSTEALWACTTCGACVEVCPVGDEPMLDLIDMRRRQVMIEGEFPQQLQSAFRGMERSRNPWGINPATRLAWADGLDVPTIAENPAPDYLYWVGCAASYDPVAQKTARSFVQLLAAAGVNFAVLNAQECCTGDSARRSGNEYLYRQLATANVALLDQVAAPRIVVTCPHCLNSLGNEYTELDGHYNVVHHTQLLDSLIAEGRLAFPAATSDAALSYHDPCYLGRHNGVYDAPRNLLRVLGQPFVELPRNRENSFCCGAGGAQFWKEEEPGDERISDNRYREAQATLPGPDATLAVGCPFCKSMLESTPAKSAGPQVKDIAELLWERLQPETRPIAPTKAPAPIATPVLERSIPAERTESPAVEASNPAPQAPRPQWKPAAAAAWPDPAAEPEPDATPREELTAEEPAESEPEKPTPARKPWKPKPGQ